jgi:hypothetical protein
LKNLKIEEKLDSILDNMYNQLSSIEDLSNGLNFQEYLLKNSYELLIRNFIQNIPNYLNIYSFAYPENTRALTLFQQQ